MGQSVKRGALVTGGSQMVKLGCQIVSVIVLSRLLQPEDFGIVAMATPVVAFVHLFQDLGLTQATVQKKGLTHPEVNSLFWISMAVSAVLAAMMVVLSPFIGQFYQEPRVTPLVAVMSIQLLVAGMGAQHHALVTRKMDFARLAVLDSISALMGLAAAIAWAYVFRTYWALFVGGLTTMIIGTIGYWILSNWRPGLPRWVGGTGGMVSFGAGITGFNFTNYIARNLDQVLIGRWWGNQQLGLYDRSYRLLLFPLQQIAYPLGRVMVPALSRMTHEPERYRHAFLRVLPLVLLFALPGVAFAVATATLFVPLVLGEQWQDSARIFQALGFAGLLQPLNSPSGWLFISQGRTTEYLRWGIFAAITSGLAFVIGLPYGAVGVATAYAIQEYLRTPLLWSYVCRKGPLRTHHVMRAALPLVLGAHVSVAALWFLKYHLPGGPAAIVIQSAILSYVIVCAVAALFPAGRTALKEMSDMIRSALPGGKTAPAD